MDLMGQPDKYGLVRATRLQSLRPKRWAVHSAKDF